MAPIFRTLLIAMIFVTGAVRAGAENVDMTQSALEAINSIRAKHGQAKLGPNPALVQAAARHASDLTKHGAFSHIGSNGSKIGDRVRRAGYRYCFVAENLAKGSPDIASVLKGWVDSPGHRANLLNKAARDVALVRGSDRLWVMVLGKDGC